MPAVACWLSGARAVRCRSAARLGIGPAGRFHIDGAFDKMLYRLSDPTFPLRLLPPYSAATEAEFARFREGVPARWQQA